jgi:hypothetical protein
MENKIKISDLTPEQCAEYALYHILRNEPEKSSAWSQLGLLLIEVAAPRVGLEPTTH